jgi:hypothetical protein
MSHRLRGDGCPYCGGRYATKENNLANYKDLLSEWDWDANLKRPEEYTPRSDKKAWWKCHKGHKWIASISHRFEGTGCPTCNGVELKDGAVCASYAEAYYYLKLKNRKIKFIHNKKYSMDNNKRFDFYVPKFSTYIEITGYSKNDLKARPGAWVKYLRNIVQKRRYVVEILKAEFRFIQAKLNKEQLLYVRKNSK